MIGKHVKGKSFRGLLNYLFGKEGAKQIGGNMEGTNPRELAAEFGISRRLNPKVSRAVYHASLSLPHHESLDDDTWHEIAQKYLQAMGFDMNQYVVVRHTDRTHEHAHIAASRIQLNGITVSDSWDNPRSEAVIRKLEKEYNLQSVQPSRRKDSRSPSTGERRQLARTGEESVRVRLQRSLDKATHDRPTMPELIERCLLYETLHERTALPTQQQGINVRIGYTRTGRVKGISYQLDGVAFSGTHLGKAYTFPGLQKYRGVSYIPKRDDQRIQKLMEQNVDNATSNQSKPDEQSVQIKSNVKNSTIKVSSPLDNKHIEIRQPVENYTPTVARKQNDKHLQSQQTVDRSTSTVGTKQDDEPIQKLTAQLVENSTPPINRPNSLPTPEPTNWKQIRQNLNQQYNLPNSLLDELYQKGWLYASITNQPVFLERTLDDVPTQAKQLEPTGDFTAIPLNSEAPKNGSFWIATNTTVTRAVLLSDPIEVLSVIALESTINKKQRQPTLYWSVSENEQIPLEFLNSLDTVVIAFKDHEEVEDLISDILVELPQAKRVSPGQTSWNQVLTDRKQPIKKQQITQTLDWEL
ncbi:relaxase/mobilization nuclease domain-containing protein [Anabaena cylindrica FACHB-243]|uniref:Relaxase/mobilization nuclease family protein n=1 Tax=Anabaena cylindrica (strain ATCC 27899 / PCC 7122) TaxID=272123 RepID=K9ZRM2_ANACC|nr:MULTISPECIES: relaxase/mobilization nuclease domain-containing protein [Anabaena]AFZ61025.1 Relaxase/mobilization nuclease family protein [Anabaena cylindrica PCC 7122]MBD2421743.1 relaxase/mobilization nuclease domain-containing protein [Anabaena cylindrica FACHB-243]MBY5281484.1 relaxase/mobilization nuclease domain-containing protein [Anabaena sp. CCAP 1446/1C]MBY5309544.1 relaxase/mobilization nuclease domain-containing protein [Anabaena sp. CCAP 1446/1C]MCM2408983.1 relaxase/mobilizati